MKHAQTVKQHPLVEIITRALFEIEYMKQDASRRMVRNCAKQAAEWHDNEVKHITEENEKKQGYVDHVTEYRNAAAALLEYLFPENTPCGDQDVIDAPAYAIKELKRLHEENAVLRTQLKGGGN